MTLAEDRYQLRLLIAKRAVLFVIEAYPMWDLIDRLLNHGVNSKSLIELQLNWVSTPDMNSSPPHNYLDLLRRSASEIHLSPSNCTTPNTAVQIAFYDFAINQPISFDHLGKYIYEWREFQDSICPDFDESLVLDWLFEAELRIYEPSSFGDISAAETERWIRSKIQSVIDSTPAAIKDPA